MLKMIKNTVYNWRIRTLLIAGLAIAWHSWQTPLVIANHAHLLPLHPQLETFGQVVLFTGMTIGVWHLGLAVKKIPAFMDHYLNDMREEIRKDQSHH